MDRRGRFRGRGDEYNSAAASRCCTRADARTGAGCRAVPSASSSSSCSLLARKSLSEESDCDVSELSPPLLLLDGLGGRRLVVLGLPRLAFRPRCFVRVDLPLDVALPLAGRACAKQGRDKTGSTWG